MVSRAATVDDIAMRWEEQGEGLPLVPIHGIPMSPLSREAPSRRGCMMRWCRDRAHGSLLLIVLVIGQLMLRARRKPMAAMLVVPIAATIRG
jgi:hypothetical protein